MLFQLCGKVPDERGMERRSGALPLIIRKLAFKQIWLSANLKTAITGGTILVSSLLLLHLT